MDKIINEVQEFKDMKDSNHWGYSTVMRMKALGLIAGYEDGTFRPNEHITRLESLIFDARMIDHIIEEILIYLRNQIPKLVKEIKPSVVVITNTYTDKSGQTRTSIGTGTVINEQGDILTNYHVVADDQQKRLGNIKIGVLEKSEEGNLEKIKYHEGEYIVGDSWIDQDMAIVKIKNLNFDLPHMPISESNLEEGHKVISYGHGGSYTYAVGKGVIAQDLQIVGGLATFGQTDATINPGNSGGLISSIWNKAIAGIPTRKVTQYDDISFYVPASRIKTFLDNNNIKYYIS